MPNSERPGPNHQTICYQLSDLAYETLEEKGGKATGIRFALAGEPANSLDILVILDGSEIAFHGTITSVTDGWGVASDPRGSALPVTVRKLES